MFNLTPGRRFCLEQLEQAEMTGREISKAAFDAGKQRRNNAEWADKYLLPLRKAKFISHTGKRRDVSQVYRINPSGRKLLSGKAGSQVSPEETSAPINLTEGRRFCLEALRGGEKTGPEISAADHGARKSTHSRAEWADKYLAFLRKNGLVEHTGARRDGANLYRITKAGKALLEA